MTDTVARASRSKAVRQSAQQRLRALREERLMRRRQVAKPEEIDPQQEAQSVCENTIGAQDTTQSKPSSTQEDDPIVTGFNQSLPEPDEDGIAIDDESSVTGDADEADATQFEDDDVSVANSELNVDAEVSDLGQSHETSDEVELAADTCDRPVSKEKLDDSDLFDLEGIGPGLVWMLHKAGVTNLSEMAQANAEDLKNKLGVVGELLDLDHWINEAANLTPSPN